VHRFICSGAGPSTRQQRSKLPLFGATAGKGWFVYFRIYGPEQPAFDSSWKPGDFEEVQ
jgi:hypothetical protein